MDSNLTIITGHFGVGKTNLSLNIAERLVAAAVPLPPNAPPWRLTLIDLDIINPYFRSSDSSELLAEKGIRLLGPVHARSTLDTPSLTPGIDDAIRSASDSQPLLIDVGGDPDGARALARFSAAIRSMPHQLLYVANFNRPGTACPDLALELLRGIEAQSGLAVTGIIGNSHLKQLTDLDILAASIPKLRSLAELAELPVVAISAPEALAAAFTAKLAGLWPSTPPAVLPLKQLVGTPWEVVARS
ncbi:MAG: ParA family protein [Actinomycetia bacterium]|nr:ParA family protein [Actinomycetes bacterium]